MNDEYTLAALRVIESYLEEAEMPVQIIQDEDSGNYHLIQTIKVSDNEEIGISYTINPESDNMEETVLVRFTAAFNCVVPDEKVNDILLYLNILNMQNSVGHYYLLGKIPTQVFEYAVPAETLGEEENFLELMFLFGYALIAANDTVSDIIENNISHEQAYANFAAAYTYFASDDDEYDLDLDGESGDENE